jgi:tetratricopeptide (TPR) repeat protein
MAWRDGVRPPDAAPQHPIDLPERPAHLRDQAVAIWSEPVAIETYRLPAPDRNPLFLENRVYQGSSGRVYPNPVTDQVTDESEAFTWKAVHLENEYLRVMVLPEIGGRIHVVQDRKTGYDIFYRQNVIKPALVGLLGPWISGGVEFNWPQHHRPSTFMLTDWQIEHLPDGGVVVWCSEHEPTERMKGMHGVLLRPGSSVLEVQVRLTNRTSLVQTFLWWANVGVRVHDEYEAYFPPDVTHVADHARRAVSTFPIAKDCYYGVDYGSRASADADLRWYRNIPVPTSYMAVGTDKDFFGGYDHAAAEGYVHWADHTISPGKKLWTWGDHEFGHAWDRELTDADGPYVELMSGVFTDNQPDFGFLLPGEVRTFKQCWYPIVGTGPAHEANLDAAVHLERSADGVRLGVAVTRPFAGATVRLDGGNRSILERSVDLAPDQSFVVDDTELPPGTRVTDLRLLVLHEGVEVISYEPQAVQRRDPPVAATEPAPPDRIESLEELYLTGMHLQQYRHATRRPEHYYREALRRDRGDSRSNTAMGEWHLRRGEYAAADRHLRAALERLGSRNTNPREGEASYLLGVSLRLQGRLREADDVFGKAGWNGAFTAAADTARAEIAAMRGDVGGALELLDRALATNAAEPGALGLRASLLRHHGDHDSARALVKAMLSADPLDVRAIHERYLLDGGADPLPGGTQTALDIAHDEARPGLLDDAIDALERADRAGADRGCAPMLHYTLGWLEARRGDDAAAARHLRMARKAAPEYALPVRLEEIEVLEWAMAQEPSDPRAPYYLGNLLYDKRRYHDAILMWRRAAKLDPDLATVHRNLGIAEFNVLGRPDRALAAYRRSLRADPTDARVFYESDQLRKRIGHAPADRLRTLEADLPIVLERDDLTVEYVSLLNRLGRYRDTIAILVARRFHPWEGGEGLVSRQWVAAHRELARLAQRDGEPAGAEGLLRTAMAYPENLGEGKHLLTPQNELQLLLGLSLRAQGAQTEARDQLERAAQPQGDPDAPADDARYWQALALRELGATAQAEEQLSRLATEAREQAKAEVRIPYFATSLPTLLLFDDDLGERSRQEAGYLEGLASLGQGRKPAARTRFMTLLDARPDHLDAALRLAELDSGA